MWSSFTADDRENILIKGPNESTQLRPSPPAEHSASAVVKERGGFTANETRNQQDSHLGLIQESSTPQVKVLSYSTFFFSPYKM